MSRFRLLHLVLPALVLPGLVLPVLLAACSAAGGSPSSEPASTESATGVRTTIEFGPDALMVAEIVEVGDDGRATVRTVAGLLGEEIVVGDDHYVRMPDAVPMLGTEHWVHIDVADPQQRQFFDENEASFLTLTGLASLEVGDEFAGQKVLAVRRLADDAVLLDLGEDRTIEVRTEEIDVAEPVTPPPADEVVALADLPGPGGG